MKLLIADDDPVFRTLLGHSARAWGHDLVLSSDGNQAWRELTSEDGPRIALLDWVMPGLDGVEICRRLRAASLPHYVYVILLTARTASDDLVAGLEAGADEFVAKPVNLEQLRLRVAAAARIVEAESRQFAGRRQTELVVGNLRGISARVFRAQEEERRAIARELHEDVAQGLSGILMSLGLVSGGGHEPRRAESLESVTDATREILARVCFLAYRLYPLLLDEIGLPAALRHYSQSVWADAAHEIDLRVPPGFQRLARPLEVGLFRIAQDAVDIARHLSGSRRVAIQLAACPLEVRLDVRGPAPLAEPDLQAIAILAIRERAEQLGGRLLIEVVADTLVISAILPLERPAGPEAEVAARD